MTFYGFRSEEEAKDAAAVARQRPPSEYMQKAMPVYGRAWLVETPSGGIPKRDAAVPGKADCSIVFIVDTGSPDLRPQRDPDDVQETIAVYNVDTNDIAENETILAIEVGNKPVAMVGGGGNGFTCADLCDCKDFFPAVPNFA